MKLTRVKARASFTDLGLTTDILTDQSLRTLINCINLRMKASGFMDDTYRMRRVRDLRVVAGRKVAELRCYSRHFENREAITFNSNGFIGFGGWADDSNIIPILEGFMDWTKDLAPTSKGCE